MRTIGQLSVRPAAQAVGRQQVAAWYWFRGLVLMFALLVAPAPSFALQETQPTDVRFWTSHPCAVACSSFMAPGAVCDREPPFAPPGTWDTHRITVPDQVDGRVPQVLITKIYPVYDSDLFLCEVLNAGTPDETYAQVPNGDDCTICEPCAKGCIEAWTTPVHPGQTFVMLVYNFVDTQELIGDYRYAVN